LLQHPSKEIVMSKSILLSASVAAALCAATTFADANRWRTSRRFCDQYGRLFFE
jgi:hypothetical protein